MASILRAYNSALVRRPYLAQCGTGAVLFGAGDVIAQQVVERKGRHHDFMRTARLTFYGGVLFAPILTKWYQFLNRLTFPSPTKAVVYRVIFFFIFALLFVVCRISIGISTDNDMFRCSTFPAAIVFFFGSMSLLEGKGVGEAQNRISTAYVPTLLRNWAVFMPAQVVNFALVPHHLRFLFISVIGLFWNTYLSATNEHHAKIVQNLESEIDGSASSKIPSSNSR